MTPTSTTTADQVRELGLSVGDVIVGREYVSFAWNDAELTLLFVGKQIAVFSQRTRHTSYDNFDWQDRGESATWTLAQRDWQIVGARL